MRISFHGAAGEVTGSCHLVETSTGRVLVDCGMFQGSHDSRQRNVAPFPFDPKTIDAVILTHAHIDHIGRVPRLVREGFEGRIFATQPTRLFAKLMWADAAHVLKDEAKRYGREPAFLPRDVEPAYHRLHGVNYDTTVRVSSDISFRFRDAGHIFGSAFVEMEAGGKKIVFSGDLGNDFVPILRPTDSYTEADVIVSESTYGDRIHEDPQHRAEHLAKAVRDAVARRGVLLIPAFSLERTQEILYELHGLVESGAVPKVSIYLDSPLAIKVLPIYHDFPEYYDREAKELTSAGDDFFQFPGLRVVKDTEESAAIKTMPTPKVVIAGSGMMHGGRIMHHLVDYLSDPKTTVLIVGFQSAGTVGRSILEGAKTVRIDHQEIDVAAEVLHINAYSAHADQAKLIRWIAGGRKLPETVVLVHGEPAASAALAEKIREALPTEIMIPKFGDTVSL